MQNTEISAPGPQTQPWRQACDCVVILQSPVSEKHPTGFLSDVTRFFAAQSRVIKVLPDLKRKTYAFAATEDPNVELLRVYRFAGPVQHGLINEALVSRRLMRPALYLDNWRFFSFYIKRFAGLKILALKETVTAVDEHVFHRMTLCSDVVIYGSEALANEHINATGCGNARLRVPWLEQYYDEAFYPGYLTRPEPPETPGRSQAGTIQEALDALNGLLNRAAGEAPRRSSLDILMLCDRKSMFTNTVREYIEAFRAYSGNSYTFADAREDFCYDNRSFGFTRELDAYDAVVIHFTVRQCFAESMSANYVRAFKQYGGYKVLMIQDDYDLTEKARKRIEELGVHEVFTPVPEAGIPKVYPPERFPGVKFHTVLTGYVTGEMANRRDFVPLPERKNVFCYRGRALHYAYGTSGNEKLKIGVDMRRICEERGIPCDIEWTDGKRIYGPAWDEFLSGARAMLSSESGANVFDFDGSLKKRIDEGLKADPDMTFQEAYERYLKDIDGKIMVNVVSPKMFEAIAHKTALVMYTGEYSGILKPDIHYIELKKDCSNIDEVIEKVMDDEYITALTERAYKDIIASGEYAYPKYVELVDGALRSAGIYSPPNIIFQIGKAERWAETMPPLRWRIKMRLIVFLRHYPQLYDFFRSVRRALRRTAAED